MDDDTQLEDETSEKSATEIVEELEIPDPIIDESVVEWLDSVDFQSTEDVPIPDGLVDQVIGQEDASVVIRKAAEQRRHMMMIGDPGTGKSMLARSMTELLPQDDLVDILCYPNDDDDNEPRVRTVPAGRGDRLIKAQRELIRSQREKQQKQLLFGVAIVAFLFLVFAFKSGDFMTLFFGLLLLAFAYMFISNRMRSGDEATLPKLLVKHQRGDEPPFIDATIPVWRNGNSSPRKGRIRSNPQSKWWSSIHR